MICVGQGYGIVTCVMRLTHIIVIPIWIIINRCVTFPRRVESEGFREWEPLFPPTVQIKVQSLFMKEKRGRGRGKANACECFMCERERRGERDLFCACAHFCIWETSVLMWRLRPNEPKRLCVRVREWKREDVYRYAYIAWVFCRKRSTMDACLNADKEISRTTLSISSGEKKKIFDELYFSNTARTREIAHQCTIVSTVLRYFVFDLWPIVWRERTLFFSNTVTSFRRSHLDSQIHFS